MCISLVYENDGGLKIEQLRLEWPSSAFAVETPLNRLCFCVAVYSHASLLKRLVHVVVGRKIENATTRRNEFQREHTEYPEDFLQQKVRFFFFFFFACVCFFVFLLFSLFLACFCLVVRITRVKCQPFTRWLSKPLLCIRYCKYHPSTLVVFLSVFFCFCF